MRRDKRSMIEIMNDYHTQVDVVRHCNKEKITYIKLTPKIREVDIRLRIEC